MPYLVLLFQWFLLNIIVIIILSSILRANILKRLLNYPKTKFSLTKLIAEPFDLNQHIPFKIAVVSNLLQLNKDPFIRDFSELEPREFRVLINIGSYMPIKAADIAYLGRLDSYTVSRAVKSLIKQQLIQVELSEANKKIKNLTLTDLGLEVYEKICHRLEQRTQELESVISSDEKKELIRILELLESKSESMIATDAVEKRSGANQIPTDQQEIVRWYKKSKSN